MNTGRWVRGIALILLATVLAGCGASSVYRKAQSDAKRERWDEAVLGYSKALAMDPGNTRYSLALERAKLKAAAEHFDKGVQYSKAAQWELAIAEFQQTLLLYPGNQHARVELEDAYVELRKQQEGAPSLAEVKARARSTSLGPPKLDPRSNIEIVLNFREVELGKIFEAISKAAQLNFIYDEKVEIEKPMTIDLGSVTVEEALDILMLQSKNFYKVIDDHTLLIAPDSRQKRQEYEDQVIRTFFLSNGDTKQAVTALRSLLQSRQITENPDLNSVTIKDTPDKVAIAEKIVNSNDKSKGEVLVDVELLEINREMLQNLGIDLTSKSMTLQFLDGQQSVPLNNLEILRQSGNWLLGPIPGVVLNFLKSDSDTRAIAKPQLRVTEGEKAEILIGDRVPIPTTSFNTSSTGVGGTVVPITSFTYQNVGITVQIEPRVHHNKEVTLTVQVEVSQISGFVSTGVQGQQQPTIGTRQIQTVIRLRDGETNMLAGLIRTEDQDSRSGVPGIMDIPGLGRALSNNQKQLRQTDIILTLTPRILRIPDITEDDLATLWVGTEENMKLRGSAKNALGASPFGTPEEFGIEPSERREPVRLELNGRGSLSRMLPSPEEVDSGAVPNRTARGEPETPAPGAGPGGPARGPGPSAGAVDFPPEDQPADTDLDTEPGAGEPPEAADEEEPVQPPSMSIVRLVPSQASYRVGDTVVVEVVIEGAEDVGSVPFHLTYNPAVVEFLEPASEGAFMGGDGAGTIFLARPSSAGNEVVVGLSRMGAEQGASGAGTLAIFQFQAIGPGNAGFGFTGASVKDPRAADMPATFVPVAVEVIP